MRTLLKISSVLAITTGILLVIGGIWAIAFIYKNIAQENIVTPAHASIPGEPVRGPLTLRAQSDVIRKDTLQLTGGKTFSQMPRHIPQFDQNGQQVFGTDGKPVMTANTARDIWITATTLTTALNLAILAYAFSGLIILFGGVLIWHGMVFHALSRRKFA